ncbi:MAG: nitrogen regulatory protein PII [Desulforhopalus sp.]|jgi:nitrogen regulatory protein PII
MSNKPKPLTTHSAPREACKLISCILRDDGTDKKLMRALRDDKKITRANSTSCMGLEGATEAKTKFGELPQPILMRKVDVVVTEAEADSLYDYIYEKARIGRPQGGAIWLNDLTLVSPFTLPENVPLEKE